MVLISMTSEVGENAEVLSPAFRVLTLTSASRRRLVSPSMLNGLERDGLVQRRQANQSVDDGTECRSFAEFHTENGGHQVEVRNAHQTQFSPPTTRSTAAITSNVFILFLHLLSLWVEALCRSRGSRR